MWVGFNLKRSGEMDLEFDGNQDVGRSSMSCLISDCLVVQYDYLFMFIDDLLYSIFE